MKGRGRRLVGLVVAVVALTSAAHAQSAGILAGSVLGVVNLAPGFTTVPPAAVMDQTWSLSSASVTGAASATQCTGVLSGVASASGASIAENLASGVGTFTIVASGSCSVGSISLACANGVYLREGVLLEATAICTSGGQAAATVFALPIAVLLPNQTPPASITSETLVGVWAIGTV
jgi:hypothetical protein